PHVAGGAAGPGLCLHNRSLPLLIMIVSFPQRVYVAASLIVMRSERDHRYEPDAGEGGEQEQACGQGGRDGDVEDEQATTCGPGEHRGDGAEPAPTPGTVSPRRPGLRREAGQRQRQDRGGDSPLACCTPHRPAATAGRVMAPPPSSRWPTSGAPRPPPEG